VDGEDREPARTIMAASGQRASRFAAVRAAPGNGVKLFPKYARHSGMKRQRANTPQTR
jgi:hypothetical protein